MGTVGWFGSMRGHRPRVVRGVLKKRTVDVHRPCYSTFVEVLIVESMLRIMSFAVILAAFGCGAEEASSPVQTEDTASVPTGLYAMDRVVEVEIELDPEDWDALRYESRNLLELLNGDCRAEPFGSPYTWFSASVTLDGERFDPVEVRKKGFIGSLSDERPSLKIDLGEFEREWNFEGARRLTLNNAISDDSVVRQCLSYSAFADAGLPAVQCGFARVWVNGEDLGLYVNVEPIKEPFLERNWGDSSGNLYEGTLSDFREDLSGTLEAKTNEDSEDRSDIDAVVAAMNSDDDQLLSALDEHIDLDQFFTHWAMEVLVKHQDGYAANTNNFYIYADPSDGRFDFISWGTDDTLSPGWWDGDGARESVFATGHLANRLYNIDEGQDRYIERLQSLLETTWQEEVLLERLDRMETALVATLDEDAASDLRASIDDVRTVVENRRGEIEAELEDGPVRWRGDVAEPFCVQQTGQFEMSLSTTWDSLSEDWTQYGDAELTFTSEDESLPLTSVGSTMGWNEGRPMLLVGAVASTGEAFVLVFWFSEEDVAPGPVEVDLIHASGNLYYVENDGTEFVYGGELGGTLWFSAAGTQSGDAINASMDGGLYVWGW